MAVVTHRRGVRVLLVVAAGFPLLLAGGAALLTVVMGGTCTGSGAGDAPSALAIRDPEAIIDDELQRALEDPDPLRGITQLTARLGAAFTLDPDGVTRTKTLGSERMARKLRDALPAGESALRANVWELMRPMLSPALVALNRDAFVLQDHCETTVDLASRHAATSLEDLDLDELNSAAV